MPLPWYACTNLTRYSASAFNVASSLFMTPPSKFECDAPVFGL